MHDQSVESLAKKLRKASVDPKKAKEKNVKGKSTNKNAGKNNNAAKKGRETARKIDDAIDTLGNDS